MTDLNDVMYSSVVQYSTIRHNAVQYGTIQHNTAKCGTIQYNAALGSII